MQTHSRHDITPKPAEFNAGQSVFDPPVTAVEVLVTLLAICTLVLTVAVVPDPWTRLAGVLVVTGALAAFVARRVATLRSV